MTTLLWFRRDLRLTDNPALESALERGGPIVCAYVQDDADAGDARGGKRCGVCLSQALLGEFSRAPPRVSPARAPPRSGGAITGAAFFGYFFGGAKK